MEKDLSPLSTRPVSPVSSHVLPGPRGTRSTVFRSVILPGPERLQSDLTFDDLKSPSQFLTTRPGYTFGGRVESGDMDGVSEHT